MPVIGDTSGWDGTFPDYLIPQILELIVFSWKTFRKPAANEHEVPITRRFRSQLIQDKNLRRLPVRIERESPEDDLLTSEEKGRIDLLFTSANYREDVYFAFECKRLNVQTSKGLESQSSEYVTEGMMRYVEAQYASSLLTGGMLGYVMDGKVSDAIKSVSVRAPNKT